MSNIAVYNTFRPNKSFSYLVPRKEWPDILGASFTKEKFKSADVGNMELRGYWVPNTKNPSSKKTVILAHGFESDPSSMLTIARHLLEKSYNVFMFDFRGHGKSPGKTSIGYHEGKDLLGAVRHIKKEHGEQSSDLTLMGHSMGASAILMLPDSLRDIENGLDDINKHVNRFVADAPYEKLDLINNSFVKSVYENKKLLADTRKQLAEKFVDRMNSEALKKQFNLPISFDEFKPAESFQKSETLRQKPLLLLHGTNDRRTPYEQAQAISDQLSHATFVTLNADHVDYAWNPYDKNRKGTKRAALRDKETFLKALDAHLSK